MNTPIIRKRLTDKTGNFEERKTIERKTNTGNGEEEEENTDKSEDEDNYAKR